MAPTNKAKAAGISATSFLDLKAELSQREADLTQSKAAGRATAVVGGGVKKIDKVDINIIKGEPHPNMFHRNQRYGHVKIVVSTPERPGTLSWKKSASRRLSLLA